MYATDTWGSFPQTELDSRAVVRERRLAKQEGDVLRPKNALVPNLQNIPVHPMKHLTGSTSMLRPTPCWAIPQGEASIPRAAVSDYEEIVERQRYLKYDLIWKRAGPCSCKKRAAKAAAGDNKDD